MASLYKKLISLQSANKKRFIEKERIVYNKLKERNITFEYQKIISPYIVDFFFPNKALIVEIDGKSHRYHNALWNDSKRDQYFLNIGIQIIKFSNDEDDDEIINKIDMFDYLSIRKNRARRPKGRNLKYKNINKFIDLINRHYENDNLVFNFNDIDFSSFKNTSYLERFLKHKRKELNNNGEHYISPRTINYKRWEYKNV